jgi:beta-lactamase superfamily II metal-dependent hydrolase
MAAARRIWPTVLVLACGDAEGGGTGEASTSAQTGAATTAAPTSTSLDGSGSAGASTSSGSEGTGAIDTGTDGTDGTGGVSDAILEIYWIDTEGGAATLLVTPDGQLVLVDAGNAGDRDADRIAAIVDEIGADAIDLCIVTHYHSDHVGGVPDLVQRVDIDAFWDHGDSVEAGGGAGLALWQDYLAVADGKRTVVVAGDSSVVGGLELTVVSAAGEVIDAPLPGAGADNPACDGAASMPVATDENPRSVGVVARFGAFDMLVLGDLTWSYEDELACPVDLVGPIDLYQTTHHGLASSGAAQLVHAIDPTVAVMNNGPHKGGAPETYDIVTSAPGMPDLWQSHLSLDNDAAHNAPDDMIANLGEGDDDMGHALHARIDAAGAITVTNRRNGHAREYVAR